MINKHKSIKAQPKSNGVQEDKVAKTHPRSNGLTNRRATSERPRKPPAQPQERTLEKFHGVLQEFNFSSKGGIEGFLLHSDGQTVQINVTPDVGFAVVRGIGQTVEATVEPVSESGKYGKGDHQVYNLVSLTGTDGKVLIFSGTGESKMATVQGTVKRINYARHGAANGVVLDNGDFIYLKPDGMKKVELKVGDHVTAEGKAAMMPLGQQVIEAKTVNGTSISGKKPPGGGSHRVT